MSKSNYVHGEGHVLLQLLNNKGEELSRRENRNLVVNVGLEMLAARIFKANPATDATCPRRVQYMQLGYSGAAATCLQTDLLEALTLTGGTGIDNRQLVVTMTIAATRTAQWQRTWTGKEVVANGIEEVGLFNSPTNAKGTMFARFVFTPVNKANTDTLKITWTLKIS